MSRFLTLRPSYVFHLPINNSQDEVCVVPRLIKVYFSKPFLVYSSFKAFSFGQCQSLSELEVLHDIRYTDLNWK